MIIVNNLAQELAGYSSNNMESNLSLDQLAINLFALVSVLLAARL